MDRASPLYLVPVDIRECETFWIRDEQAFATLVSLLAGLSERLGVRQVIATCSDQSVADLLRRNGVECPVVAEQKQTPFLPPGGLGALEHVEGKEHEGPVVLIDFRVVGEVEAAVQKVLDQWRASRKTSITMRPPQDHPAQFNRFGKYVGIGVVNIFKDTVDLFGVPCLSTRPCLVVPPQGASFDSPEEYWVADSLACRHPRIAQNPVEILSSGESLARFTGRGCEFLVPEAVLPALAGHEVVGVAMVSSGVSKAFLLNGPQGHALWADTIDTEADVVLIPDLQGDQSAYHCLQVRPMMPLPEKPSGATLPYIAVRLVTEGSYDVSFGYETEVKLWKTIEHKTINLVTNSQVTGRQSLPECFELAPMIVAGEARAMLDIENELFAGKVAGVDAGTGIRRIENVVDYIEYEAQA